MAATVEVTRLDELREAIGATGRRPGLILTRGFLHPGHLRLAEAARAGGLAVVVGVFLHARQFAPGDSPALYPRDFSGDAERAREYGVDVLWHIASEDAFPANFATEVRLPAIERTLSSVVHPDVLRAQVTTTFRLVNLAGADAIYFGELDWYKARCVERTLRDLGNTCAVSVVETARDERGLAYAALNSLLAPDEQGHASRIYPCLAEARRLFSECGEREVARLLGRTSAQLTRIPGFRLQYVHLLDPETLKERTIAAPGDVLMIGGFFGRTRIADAVRLPLTTAAPSA